jgi:N-acetylglucosaminyl-diphospho-decaprenol L-rhamnosyltransferase
MGMKGIKARALSEAEGPHEVRVNSPATLGLNLSVVVVSYNARDCLARCLQQLANRGIEIVVVDNGSNDGSPQLVENRYPHVQLVDALANRGYGAAANLGMEHANGEYYLVLNADAWPKAEGIERLIAYAEEHPNVGVLAPTLRAEDGNVQRSLFAHPSGRLAVLSWAVCPRLLNIAYTTWRRLAERLPTTTRGRIRRAQPTVGTSAFVIGAALLLRADAAKQIGGFDPNFFMFNEDADLCLRMQEAGWSIALVPDAEFVHVGAASTRAEPDWMLREHVRSHVRFVAKHAGLGRAEQMRRILILGLTVRGGLRRRSPTRDAARWLASESVATLLASHE